jgi:hypothetical protein
LILRRRKKNKKIHCSADSKLHIGYTRDSRIINLLHRSLLKEELEIEKKKEEKERRTRRYIA